MQKIRHYIYSISGWASGFCLIAMTILILAQITARFFGITIPSSEDFAGWLLSASIFFGLAYTFNTGGHIRLTILLGRLPKTSRRVFEAIALLIGLGIVAFVAFYTSYTVYESFDFEDITDTYLPMPLWVVQLPMAIGSLFLLFAFVDAFIVLLSGKMPNYINHEE